jgi:outer membrane protein assembly factor BamE (lipoprotein component of BamABCDE complex)
MWTIFKRVGVRTTAIGLLLCQSGCMTPGEKLESTAVNELRKGQTEAEVRHLFGAPKRSDTSANGKTLDVFFVIFPRFTTAPSIRSRVRVLEVRSLHVLYDNQGRVDKFTFYVGESKSLAGPGRDWRAGRWLDQNQVSNIKRGITSRSDLVAMLGPATVQGLNVYGVEVWSWLFVEGRAGTQTKGRELLVTWDEKSRVKDFLLQDRRQ